MLESGVSLDAGSFDATGVSALVVIVEVAVSMVCSTTLPSSSISMAAQLSASRVFP